MRRIVVVGAGLAGLPLAIGLQQRGYAVTMVTDRDAEAVRTGRLLSTQIIADAAIRHDRKLGINFWDSDTAKITRFAFDAANGQGGREPAISWQADVMVEAHAVDQRLRMSGWLEEFTRLGGELRIRQVVPEDLEEYAREFELVLVGTGRGPQFEKLFVRDDRFSPFREPQRAIGAMYVNHAGAEPKTGYSGCNFSLCPDGLVVAFPVLSVSGPAHAVFVSGVPGGPLDCWDEVTDAGQHLEVTAGLLRTHLPWLAELMDGAQPNGPLDYLHGRVTPVVRDPVGRLASGALVLAMGDTAVTNDPIGGQGANMASRCAAVYMQAILDQENRPFDEPFMRRCFAGFWEHAKLATRISNDLFAPPAPHVMATLITAQTVPEVAQRFAHIFARPADYCAWLTDEDVALRYLQEATARKS